MNPASQGEVPQEGQERAAAERRGAPPAAALPCLLVTTQPELARGEAEEKAAQVNKLQGSHKRSAQCLSLDVIGLAKRFGLERLGSLTLTFVENVCDRAAAYLPPVKSCGGVSGLA